MKTFTYLIAFLVSTTVMAQNQEFSDTIDALNNELKTVESGKYKYSQKILVNQPGIVSLEIYRITLKDSKSSIMNYEFNFADIDINTVRTSLEKDLINVQLLADKNQKLLRVTENKEKIYFTNEIFLQATDVENGKALEESIKTAIQLAKKIIKNRLSLNTYGEHMDWLSMNIKDVSLIKNQYTQSMAGLGYYPGKIEYRVSENNDKSSKNEVFQFNTSTLNPNSLLLTIEGELLSVYMETSRKLKTIKYFREGQQQNYTSNIKVVFESVELARDFQIVMKELITLSKTKFKNSLQKISSITDGLNIINKIAAEVIVNENKTSQKLEGDCVVTFKQNFENSSKNSINEFIFNFKDLNKNSTTYTTKGQEVFLTVDTKGGNNLIKHTEDGEQKNFDKELTLYASEVEDAIVVKNAIQKVIELCNQQDKEYKNLSTAEKIEVLKTTLKKITINDVTYEQNLSSDAEGLSMTYKKTKITANKSIETISEFNLKDINPGSVTMETSGRNVVVTATTYYMDKVIKFYQDGEIKNYQNKIEIEANDIENARSIKILLAAISGKD